MWVALIGVVINFISALLFKKNQHTDLNIKAAYWHLMADALVSLGVVVSGVLIHYFHWYALDGITAIVIAAVVLASTWTLFRDSAVAILDGIPKNVNPVEIKEQLLQVAGVKAVHHLHIWGMSTNENAITAHIIIEDVHELPAIKKTLKEVLDKRHLRHSTLEFEIESEQCNETNL